MADVHLRPLRPADAQRIHGDVTGGRPLRVSAVHWRSSAFLPVGTGLPSCPAADYDNPAWAMKPDRRQGDLPSQSVIGDASMEAVFKGISSLMIAVVIGTILMTISLQIKLDLPNLMV